MTQITETTLNQQFKDRWAVAAATAGTNHLPREIEFALQEQHRLEWCEFLGRDARGRLLVAKTDADDAPAPSQLEDAVTKTVTQIARDADAE